MNYPKKVKLCKECSKVIQPQWFRNKIHEWVDMDYPYASFRPMLIVAARKDLCPECAARVVEAADRVNAFGTGYSGGGIT